MVTPFLIAKIHSFLPRISLSQLQRTGGEFLAGSQLFCPTNFQPPPHLFLIAKIYSFWPVLESENQFKPITTGGRNFCRKSVVFPKHFWKDLIYQELYKWTATEGQGRFPLIESNSFFSQPLFLDGFWATPSNSQLKRQLSIVVPQFPWL